MSSSSDPQGARARVRRDLDAWALPPASVTALTPTRILELLGGGELGPSPAETLAAERQAAYEEGFRAARQEAAAAADATRAEAAVGAAGALRRAAEAAAGERARLVADATADALELTYELAHVLIGSAAAAGALPSIETLAAALGLAPEGEDLLLRVHPSAAIGLDELSGLCAGQSIELREDPSIEPGGYVVEAGPCRIDAQISSALERVRTLLEAHRAGALVGAGMPGPEALGAADPSAALQPESAR